jgi:hypothetical protein
MKISPPVGLLCRVTEKKKEGGGEGGLGGEARGREEGKGMGGGGVSANDK